MSYWLVDVPCDRYRSVRWWWVLMATTMTTSKSTPSSIELARYFKAIVHFEYFLKSILCVCVVYVSYQFSVVFTEWSHWSFTRHSTVYSIRITITYEFFYYYSQKHIGCVYNFQLIVSSFDNFDDYSFFHLAVIFQGAFSFHDIHTRDFHHTCIFNSRLFVSVSTLTNGPGFTAPGLP